MEAPPGPATAENVANFFHNQAPGDSGTSAHVCIDENSIVDCVRESDTAWAVPNANSDGLSIELAGYARETREDWLKAENLSMLELAASRAARYAHRYKIPIKHLSITEIRSGAKGFVGHVDITNALNGGVGHTDPGPNFPWPHFINRIQAHYDAQNPAPKPKRVKHKSLSPVARRRVRLASKSLRRRKAPLNHSAKRELHKLNGAIRSAEAIND